MNKILAGILAVSMTAGLVSAQEPDPVLSRNAVGYVKLEVDESKIYLVSTPFSNVATGTDDHNLLDLVGNLPNLSAVTLWDEETQQYIGFTKSARGAWSAGAETATITRGQSMFIRMPSAVASTNIVLMGEVPDSDTEGSRTTGISFKSYPFPVDKPFLETALASNAPNLTVVSAWDEVSQGVYCLH